MPEKGGLAETYMPSEFGKADWLMLADCLQNLFSAWMGVGICNGKKISRPVVGEMPFCKKLAKRALNRHCCGE